MFSHSFTLSISLYLSQSLSHYVSISIYISCPFIPHPSVSIPLKGIASSRLLFHFLFDDNVYGKTYQLKDGRVIKVGVMLMLRV